MKSKVLAMTWLVGCTGGSPPEESEGGVAPAIGTLVEAANGEEVELRSGFAFESGDGDRGVLLTNATDACTSATWWQARKVHLWELLSDPYVGPDEVQEAVENTAAVFADEWTTSHPVEVILWLPELPTDQRVDLDVADAFSGSYASDHLPVSVDWYQAPVYEVDGSRTTLAYHLDEAYSTSGEGTLTLGASDAEGSVAATVRTEALAEFEITADFAVTDCPSWVEAWF